MKRITYSKTLTKEELIVLLLERDQELAQLEKVEAEQEERWASVQAQRLLLAQSKEETILLFGG